MIAAPLNASEIAVLRHILGRCGYDNTPDPDEQCESCADVRRKKRERVKAVFSDKSLPLCVRNAAAEWLDDNQ